MVREIFQPRKNRRRRSASPRRRFSSAPRRSASSRYETRRQKEKKRGLAVRISTSLLVAFLGLSEGIDLVTEADIPTLSDLFNRNSLVVDPPQVDYLPVMVTDQGTENASAPPAGSNQNQDASPNANKVTKPTRTPTTPPTPEPKPTLEPPSNQELPANMTVYELNVNRSQLELQPNSVLQFGTNSSIETNEIGLPIRATIYGETKELNPDTIAQLRQKAIQTGIPQVFHADTYTIPQEFPPSQEHPTYPQLPPEFIDNPELLAKHGIKIIQGKYSQLAISEAAFQPGGPLEKFSPDGDTLTIVIVDGPLVSTTFMGDPKYDSVRGLLAHTDSNADENFDIQAYQQQKAESYRRELISIETEITQLLNQSQLTDEEKIDLYLKKIAYAELQAQLYKIENGQIPDMEVILSNTQTEAAGLYIPRYASNSEQTIFVAVGPDQPGKRRGGTFSFNEHGKVEYADGLLNSKAIISLSPLDSHQNPANLNRNLTATPDDPESYPFKGQNAGLVLHHERSHEQLIREGWFPTGYDAQGNVLGWEQKFTDSKWPFPIPNWSEYDTDMRAYEQLEKAWDRWQESGFTDRSGYYFAFSLPKQSDSDPTEYILTRQDAQRKTDIQSQRVAQALATPRAKRIQNSVNQSWRATSI